MVDVFGTLNAKRRAAWSRAHLGQLENCLYIAAEFVVLPLLSSLIYEEKFVDAKKLCGGQAFGENAQRNVSDVDLSKDDEDDVAVVEFVCSACIEDRNEENVRYVEFTVILLKNSAKNCK